MALFEKKELIYRKKDAETWKKIRKVLKEEGITGVHASHFYAESLSACGCGAHLDPRDFGSKGKIDRDVYFIEVPVSQVQKAEEAVRRHGLVTVVDKEAEKDVTEKYSS